MASRGGFVKIDRFAPDPQAICAAASGQPSRPPAPKPAPSFRGARKREPGIEVRVSLEAGWIRRVRR
jgi:hypothetical protein